MLSTISNRHLLQSEYLCSPKIYEFEVLKFYATVMVLEGGAWGRKLSHESGALMNGVSALINKTPQCL